MEKQHNNLVAVVKRACDEDQWDTAWRTCRALMEFFEIRGMWESGGPAGLGHRGRLRYGSQ
jgi:hypothetical protein